MKLKSKHSSLKLVLLLSTVSLATVGFSAWVINGSLSGDTSKITFSVGEVTDNSITVKVIDSTNNSIAFDSISGGASDKVQGNSKSEDMTFGVKYTVTSGKGFSNPIKITYNYTTGFGEIKKIGDGTNYINTSCLDITTFNLDGETTNPSSISGLSVSYEGNVATVTQTWTFSWGSVFATKNPCNVTSEDGDAYTNLEANLKAFTSAAKTAMTGKDFTITITPSFAA